MTERMLGRSGELGEVKMIGGRVEWRRELSNRITERVDVARSGNSCVACGFLSSWFFVSFVDSFWIYIER